MTKHKLWFSFVILVLVVSSLFWMGCDEDDKKDDDDPAAYMASQAVQSNENVVVETESGAMITIPDYAVPLTDDEEVGTMVFSIERDEEITAPVPTGETMAGDVYRFGPDGFVFSAPVRVTIPVTGDHDPEEYRLYRINQTTGVAERFHATYDAEAKTVSAETYELSPWFPTFSSSNQYVDGAIQISNSSSSKWMSVSVVSCVPLYPDFNTAPDCGVTATFAPSGTIGWNSSGNWYLVQGTYTLCVSMQEKGTFSSPPGPPSHIYVYDVVIDQPWTYSNQQISSTISSGIFTDPIEGPCDCIPTPTPSPGTGDVQVTLTWHNASSIDLDLWVVEPNEDRCFYSNTPTTTGGTLDRDNLCSNYINGRPENIFWDNAPVGEYLVQVDWFSSCGNTMTTQSFDVRVINGTSARTYSGVVSTGETVDVCTFRMNASLDGGMSEYIGTGSPNSRTLTQQQRLLKGID